MQKVPPPNGTAMKYLSSMKGDKPKTTMRFSNCRYWIEAMLQQSEDEI
jgi:hypothetical protein